MSGDWTELRCLDQGAYCHLLMAEGERTQAKVRYSQVCPRSASFPALSGTKVWGGQERLHSPALSHLSICVPSFNWEHACPQPCRKLRLAQPLALSTHWSSPDTLHRPLLQTPRALPIARSTPTELGPGPHRLPPEPLCTLSFAISQFQER